jgi:hypothetical protein
MRCPLYQHAISCQVLSSKTQQFYEGLLTGMLLSLRYQWKNSHLFNAILVSWLFAGNFRPPTKSEAPRLQGMGRVSQARSGEQIASQ